MRYKKVGFFSLLAFLLVIFFPLAAGAQMCQKEGKGGCSIEKKVMCKLRLAMVHQDEVGLSDDQVTKIRQLKMSVKKELIKRKTDIDLIGIDIKSKLGEEEIDKKGIGKLIDQKYDLKKEKAKAMVDAYADLVSILSAEQNKILRKMCRQGTGCPGKDSSKFHGKCPRGNI